METNVCSDRRVTTTLLEVFIHLFAHQPSHLESYGSLGWDMDGFQGPGVFGIPGLSDLWFKDTKVSEFQTVVFGKFHGDLIEEFLHYCFDGCQFEMSLFCDSIREFLFGCCRQLSDSSEVCTGTV